MFTLRNLPHHLNGHMSYNKGLAAKVRDYLSAIPALPVEEKQLFGGLAFLVNGKMCINVTGDSLMCRFDPVNLPEISRRKGFRPMIMKGKKLAGYCYVDAEGFNRPNDFSYWIETCLLFNGQVKGELIPRKN